MMQPGTGLAQQGEVRGCKFKNTIKTSSVASQKSQLCMFPPKLPDRSVKAARTERHTQAGLDWSAACFVLNKTVTGRLASKELYYFERCNGSFCLVSQFIQSLACGWVSLCWQAEELVLHFKGCQWSGLKKSSASWWNVCILTLAQPDWPLPGQQRRGVKWNYIAHSPCHCLWTSQPDTLSEVTQVQMSIIKVCFDPLSYNACRDLISGGATHQHISFFGKERFNGWNWGCLPWR